MRLPHRACIRSSLWRLLFRKRWRNFCAALRAYRCKLTKPLEPSSMKRITSGAFALILLAGCATTQSIPVETRTRTYDANFDQVFDAVVAAFAVDGYAVTDANRDSGIINTDERVRLGMRLFQGNRTKVTALVQDSDAGTTVVLNLSTSSANEEGGAAVSLMPKSAAREFYRELFGKIEAQLNR